MTTPLSQDLAAERQQRLDAASRDLLPRIDLGAGQETLQDLLYFAPPNLAARQLSVLNASIETGFAEADLPLQTRRLRFVMDLSIALRSFLPLWNLANSQRHGEQAWAPDQVAARADETTQTLARLCAAAPAAASKFLDQIKGEITARLTAEKAEDPTAQAARLAGRSLVETVAGVTCELEGSQLRRITMMRLQGQTDTEIGNDYAAFLQYALYLGASFATTNPPLVDMAWTALPEHWTPVVDQIIRSHPDENGDQLARRVTLEVVLENMRLLRPIFLLYDGRMGCVCLQVNPNLHDNAPAMIADARFFWEQIRTRLDGHTPNVVFKLPGTRAGLKAAQALTAEGMGVTITVQFGMFQHVPFAQVLREGTAPYSCLVEMNGRLAYPVRDELLARLDELESLGFDEASVRCAAAYAGVAVVKKLHRLLDRQGIDLDRVRPLIASLRQYTDPIHQRLPNAFPDVTEVLGTRIISVFPDIRHAFDHASLTLPPAQLQEPLSAKTVEILSHSEIFRQAYHVSNPDWGDDGTDNLRPRRPLDLSDSKAVLQWPPIDNTLTQFRNSYDQFVDRILARRSHMKREDMDQ